MILVFYMCKSDCLSDSDEPGKRSEVVKEGGRTQVIGRPRARGSAGITLMDRETLKRDVFEPLEVAKLQVNEIETLAMPSDRPCNNVM